MGEQYIKETKWEKAIDFGSFNLMALFYIYHSSLYEEIYYKYKCVASTLMSQTCIFLSIYSNMYPPIYLFKPVSSYLSIQTCILLSIYSNYLYYTRNTSLWYQFLLQNNLCEVPDTHTNSNVCIKAFWYTIYIFDSDIIWRMQLMIIKCSICVVCLENF